MSNKVEIIEELIGKTFSDVKQVSLDGDAYSDAYGDQLHFVGAKSYQFYHTQDCCEHVRIEEIVGNLSDLIGPPITQAEAVSERHADHKYDTSETWTFYKFATMKGSVTVRWLGESNGYYSEEVYFKELKENR